MIGTRSGFTLLELLVVIAIIALLSGLGAKGYALARRQAKEARASTEIELLRTALNEYRVEYGSYPEQANADSFQSLEKIGWLTNAIESIALIDPWGRAYQYQSNNRFQYRIWSEGQDPNTATDNITLH